MNDVVTQAEAARALGCHPNTIATMLGDGRLEPVVVGASAGPRQPVRRVAGASLRRRLEGKACSTCGAVVESS